MCGRGQRTSRTSEARGPRTSSTNRAEASGPRKNERGSTLLGLIIVTALLSIAAAALMIDIASASRIAVRKRASLTAFQAAEAGLEAGRLAFENTNDLFGIPRTTGTLPGATFDVRPGVGNFGTESWPQWGFDPRASRNNPTSTVGEVPRLGWRTAFSPAKNGDWAGGHFYGNNLFAVVANQIAFLSYENPVDGTINIAAFSSLDGSVLWQTDTNSLLGDGLALSAMATIEEAGILVFTYLSENTAAGTVRLMALDVNDTTVAIRWTFDTGIHGLGSPPAIYNPDPTAGGEEIIYFTVAEAPDWQVSDVSAGRTYPELGDRAEGVSVFAVRDGGPGNAIAKWAHPFPDPEVSRWTDYPTERWTVPAGSIDRPARVYGRPPDEDLIVDYYNSNAGMLTTVLGDLYMVFDPQSFSPPVLMVEDMGTATTADDHIHIYVYYAVISDKDIAGGSWYQNADTPPAAGNERIHWQAEMVALRDTPAARFPQFAFTYNPPAWDVNRADGIPWDGYLEENWETWFEQSSAPMITRQTQDPNGVVWPGPRTVLFLPYESLEWVTPTGFNIGNTLAQSKAMIMGVVDRYDDFAAGTSAVTHENYWVDALGPNPYAWTEQDIIATGAIPHPDYGGADNSLDIDIEGESLAYDEVTNVLYFIFNQDLNPIGQNRETLRIHAIDAVNGQGRAVTAGVDTHLWDHHRPAKYNGDAFNATPAIAGGLLYFIYLSPDNGGRTAQLMILHTNDGSPTATSPLTIDTDCDVADIAPSVANDAIYLGTYDDADNIQRVFALSPSVWLLSTGVTNDGKARRTLAMRQEDSRLVEWREGGFAGGIVP